MRSAPWPGLRGSARTSGDFPRLPRQVRSASPPPTPPTCSAQGDRRIRRESTRSTNPRKLSGRARSRSRRPTRWKPGEVVSATRPSQKTSTTSPADKPSASRSGPTLANYPATIEITSAASSPTSSSSRPSTAPSAALGRSMEPVGAESRARTLAPRRIPPWMANDRAGTLTAKNVRSMAALKTILYLRVYPGFLFSSSKP